MRGYQSVPPSLLASVAFFKASQNPESRISTVWVQNLNTDGCPPIKLEKLQSEIGERILKLAPIIGLHLPSFKTHTVIQEVHFLDKLMESEWTDHAS